MLLSSSTHPLLAHLLTRCASPPQNDLLKSQPGQLLLIFRTPNRCGILQTLTPSSIWVSVPPSQDPLASAPSVFITQHSSAQTVKNLPAMWEIWVQSLGWEDPLEAGMATHSRILAWGIPWTEQPGGLQSMGLQGAGLH